MQSKYKRRRLVSRRWSEQNVTRQMCVRAIRFSMRRSKISSRLDDRPMRQPNRFSKTERRARAQTRHFEKLCNGGSSIAVRRDGNETVAQRPATITWQRATLATRVAFAGPIQCQGREETVPERNERAREKKKRPRGRVSVVSGFRFLRPLVAPMSGGPFYNRRQHFFALFPTESSRTQPL